MSHSNTSLISMLRRTKFERSYYLNYLLYIIVLIVKFDMNNEFIIRLFKLFISDSHYLEIKVS